MSWDHERQHEPDLEPLWSPLRYTYAAFDPIRPSSGFDTDSITVKFGSILTKGCYVR